jgi:hypothetical protein
MSGFQKSHLVTPAGTRYTELPHYKYRIASTARFDIAPRHALDLSGREKVVLGNYDGTKDLVLITSRVVWVYPGYSYNGADWAIDTRDFLDGALVHDVLCQAMTEGDLDPANHKRVTAIMAAENRKHGMSMVRLCYTRASVNAHWKHKVKSMPWPADAI